MIVDPFCGTGSAGVAALRTGSYFIGVDSDPACVRATGTFMEKQSEGVGMYQQDSKVAMHLITQEEVRPVSMCEFHCVTLMVFVLSLWCLCCGSSLHRHRQNPRRPLVRQSTSQARTYMITSPRNTMPMGGAARMNLMW